jgi:hypothetical protein
MRDRDNSIKMNLSLRRTSTGDILFRSQDGATLRNLVDGTMADSELTEEERKEEVQKLVDQCIGCIFGRMVAYALGWVLLMPALDLLFGIIKSFMGREHSSDPWWLNAFAGASFGLIVGILDWRDELKRRKKEWAEIMAERDQQVNDP